MAPEIHLNQPYDGTKIDVFSAGIILFIMMTCRLPFEGEACTGTKLYKYISEKRFDKFWAYHVKESPTTPCLQSVEFRDLFQKMVSLDPEERPSLETISMHAWVQNDDVATTDYIKQYFIEKSVQLQQTKK